MSELPWRCSACGYENWVDFESLSAWPIDKVRSVRGFVCKGCGEREAVLYTSSSLEETLRKLNRYPPSHRQFQFLLAKCIRKAEALRQRGECDGTQQRQNLVES